MRYDENHIKSPRRYPTVPSDAVSGTIVWTDGCDDQEKTIEIVLRAAEQSLIRGGADWAELTIVTALGIKPHRYASKQLPSPERVDQISRLDRQRIVLLLARTTEITGNRQYLLTIGRSLLGLPSYASTSDWVVALRQIEDRDQACELSTGLCYSALSDRSLWREIDPTQLMRTFIGDRELSLWCNQPDVHLNSVANQELLAAYLASLSGKTLIEESKTLRDWLLERLSTRRESATSLVRLAYRFAQHIAGRCRSSESVQIIEAIARQTPPSLDSSGFCDASLPAALVADLVLLWLENANGVPHQQRFTLADQLNTYLEQLPAKHGRQRQRLIGLQFDWARTDGASRNSAKLLDAILRLETGLNLETRSSWSAKPRADESIQPAASVPPGDSAAMEKLHAFLEGWGNADDAPIVQAAGEAYTTSIDRAGQIALFGGISAVHSSDLAQDGWNSADDQASELVERMPHYSPCQSTGPSQPDHVLGFDDDVAPTTESHGDRDQRPGINQSKVIELLARYRAPLRPKERPKSVVLLVLQPSVDRLVVYCFELTPKKALRWHFPRREIPMLSLTALEAKLDRFERSISESWEAAESDKASPNLTLASGLSQTLKSLLEWTDRQLSAVVSDVLLDCGDEPDVLISADGIAQSLLVDLITVKRQGVRPCPLLGYANSVRWIPNIAMQHRLNAASEELAGQANWAKELMTFAYLPILDREHGEGGYYRVAAGDKCSVAHEYLGYRQLPQRGQEQAGLYGSDVRAWRVAEAASGICRDLLLLAHGCPDKGAILLWDELLDRFGPAPRLETLMLVSCDMGRFGSGDEFSAVSKNMLSRILKNGMVSHVGAFRYRIPDVPGVHFALGLLDAHRRPSGSGESVRDLAGVRDRMLRRLFLPASDGTSDTETAADACTMTSDGADVARMLRRWVAAVSIAYSGHPNHDR